jgi:hypothetical protein
MPYQLLLINKNNYLNYTIINKGKINYKQENLTMLPALKNLLQGEQHMESEPFVAGPFEMHLSPKMPGSWVGLWIMVMLLCMALVNLTLSSPANARERG